MFRIMSDRGVELTPSLLLNAYAAGVFPMADSADDPSVYWVDPTYRGVLPFEKFHVPKSLLKRLRKDDVTVTVDRVFEQVLDGCADRSETWINDTIRALYTQLHNFGYCHSVEIWMDDELAGGLYGVALGGVFFGESMFSNRPDASKIALVALMARLRVGGFTLLDTQFVTEHLRRFGAAEIPRSDYLRQLAHGLDQTADWLRLQPEVTLHEMAQLSTQTS